MIELTATIEGVRLSSDEKPGQQKCQVTFRFQTPAYNTLTLNVDTATAKDYAKMMSEGGTLVFKQQVQSVLEALGAGSEPHT